MIFASYKAKLLLSYLKSLEWQLVRTADFSMVISGKLVSGSWEVHFDIDPINSRHTLYRNGHDLFHDRVAKAFASGTTKSSERKTKPRRKQNLPN